MRITIHGAAGEVTGSCHLLEFGRQLLADLRRQGILLGSTS